MPGLPFFFGLRKPRVRSLPWHLKGVLNSRNWIPAFNFANPSCAEILLRRTGASSCAKASDYAKASSDTSEDRSSDRSAGMTT